MDANPVSCPVCTLYLRPGITLKNHLSSHPKQKVIEALCRLSDSAIEDIPKIENSLQTTSAANQQSEVCSAISSQLNTAILNQSWNQGNMVNMPPAIPPGNHVFIYQQSMSSSSTTSSSPQQNVLNVNPLSPQYVIPTVLNPQMMPYIYQQQQVIMSSGSCLSPMRTLPLELPAATPECSITEEADDESLQTAADDEKCKIEKFDEIKNDGALSAVITQEIELEPATVDVTSSENYDDADGMESLCSHDEPELNKACQTSSENSATSQAEDEGAKTKLNKFYYVNEEDAQNEEQQVDNFESQQVFTTAASATSTTQFDFVDMDSMHVVISDMNEFSGGQIISQVENFEGSAPDRPGVLMTIGGMDKDDYIEHESMSRESSNVNIRADERMPPRGELSGQESLGGSSDIAWHRVTYTEGTSAMSTSYDLLGRGAWDASDNSSDVEALPPLQSRLPVIYPENEEDTDNPIGACETSSAPLIRCSICSKTFATSFEKDDHEFNKHLTKKQRKINEIGANLETSKKGKKLIVKPKVNIMKVETVNNFDNVFTNKLKIELAAETENVDENNGEVDTSIMKTDDGVGANSGVEVKAVCPLCDCVLLNAKALKEHKHTVHNITAQTRHKCTTCGEQFPNDYKFTEHLRIHPLECKLCGRLFYRRQNIQLHMRRHLGIKPYKCETCEKAFLTKQKLDEHRNIHTGNAPIKCNLCNETFRRHSNLVQHRNRHHLNVKKKLKDYMCSCKEVFHSKKKLAWHKEIHDAKPKSCTECNEKFIHMSSLTRHMRRAHNDKFLPNEQRTRENVVCPICNGVYLKSSLEVHIRNHSGQRPYTCLICNKDFTTKWNLKLHKWTHASRVSKPFKCDQCKGAFIREADYVAHMNSHKSVRPYTCNYCGAQFIRKYNCQRHVKEHENEKMFSCQVCGKQFHRSYYLKDHMRIHSGARPFSCHICGKTSTTKSNHNKHVQIHHAREPVSTEN